MTRRKLLAGYRRQEQTAVARLCALLFACLPICAAMPMFAQSSKIPLPPPQKSVDYNSPQRVYDKVRMDGWTVFVENPLRADFPDISSQTLTRLQKKLREALQSLPAAARPRLKKLPLFLMIGPAAKNGGRDNGLEYFQKTAPHYDRTLDMRWANCIVIYCADNYLRISEFWALKALVHEFAHAYQLAQWPEDQPDIYQAWDNARRQGLYRGIRDDQGKRVEAAYAQVNPLEYFAELSCMYFVGCNYQPSNRAELQTYDPVGCAMIEKMWKIKRGTDQRRAPTVK